MIFSLVFIACYGYHCNQHSRTSYWMRWWETNNWALCKSWKRKHFFWLSCLLFSALPLAYSSLALIWYITSITVINTQSVNQFSHHHCFAVFPDLLTYPNFSHSVCDDFAFLLMFCQIDLWLQINPFVLNTLI